MQATVCWVPTSTPLWRKSAQRRKEKSVVIRRFSNAAATANLFQQGRRQRLFESLDVLPILQQASDSAVQVGSLDDSHSGALQRHCPIDGFGKTRRLVELLPTQRLNEGGHLRCQCLADARDL